MSIAEDKERYQRAGHAMQTGVALEMAEYGDSVAGTSAKHLRVGVNAAMADQNGLVTLLIEKGLFTNEEYHKAVADSMEEERARYQAKMPPNVTLA